MRVLIAYEDSHSVYAEAMRHAIQALRPGAEVATLHYDEPILAALILEIALINF